MAENVVTFELNVDDVVGAARHIALRRLPIRPQILVACAIVAGVLGLLLARGPEDHLLRVLALMVLVMALVVTIVFLVVIPWQARKHFRELASAKGPMSFGWSEEGICLSGKRGETRLQWTDFYRWCDTDNILILMQSSLLYNIVPKLALSEQQLREIRSHLDAAKVKAIRS